MGFSQSIYTASEDNSFVEICAELLEGELGIDISISVSPGSFVNDSGIRRSICIRFLHSAIRGDVNFIPIATHGRDYVGLPHVLSFVSGQSLHSTSCVSVNIIDDANLEEKENFTVVLSVEFPGVTLSRHLSIVEIIDNDSKGKSQIAKHFHSQDY